MRDLFAEPPVPGLAYRDAVIAEDEEADLIARIDAVGLAAFQFHGWSGNRLTRSFGWRYDFEDSSFRQTEPIPDWLTQLRRRAAELAGIAPGEFAHILLIRYDPGAGIGWHRDRPQFDKVVGVSLCNAATMRFRQRIPGGFRRANVPLEPRSAYLLDGEVRSDWEHSIAPGETLRYSITFRSLSARGRAAAGLT